MVCVPISKIVYPGKSLGYSEGKVVFTDEGLPGEIVEVEPKKIKKNYLEGITRAILQTSAQRRPPRCGHYRACAPYQIMDYDFQLEIKQEQLREIFRHQLRLDLTSLTVIPSPLVWGYRNRAHFHLIWQEENPVLAYHQPGTLTEFMPVVRCFLLPEKANDVFEQILEILRAENLREIKEIEVRYSFTTGDILIIFFLDDRSIVQTIRITSNEDSFENSSSEEEKAATLFSLEKDNISSKIKEGFLNSSMPTGKNHSFSQLKMSSSFSDKNNSTNKSNKDNNGNRIEPKLNNLLERLRKVLTCLPVAGALVIVRKEKEEQKHLLFGQPLLWEEIQGVRYAIGPQTFFQVNVPILGRFINDLKAIIPLTGKELLADLYCGVGTFGLALASKVAEVHGVELLPENIAFLKKNLEENGIDNFKIVAGAAFQWAHKILSPGLDVVIVDPPRRGLEKMTVKALNDHPCRYLLYLSCNPSTLARDLNQLLKTYELKEVRFYDFFPQTPHIETLAILQCR